MKPVLAITLALCCLTTSVSAATIAGTARVIDGDTISIDRESIRLAGIDACELTQVIPQDGKQWPCGELAAGRLVAWTTGKKVSCDWEKRDKYKRILGICSAGKRNLNEGLLIDGLARAYYHDRMAETAHYPKLEQRAKTERRGMWYDRLEAQAPAAYRAAAKEPKIKVWRLYRSAVNLSKEIHVATFDLTWSAKNTGVDDVNKASCEHTRDLYLAQPGIKVRYWCVEVKGR